MSLTRHDVSRAGERHCEAEQNETGVYISQGCGAASDLLLRAQSRVKISILMFLVAVHMLLAVYQAAAVSILMFLVMVARRDLRHTYAAASRSVTFLKV